MPEGDTLHRIAARVGGGVAGGVVERLFLADRGDVRDAVGWGVENVFAVGKHLLVGFDSGWALRTHLGMNGRVFAVPLRGEPPRGPTFLIRVDPRSGASSAGSPGGMPTSPTPTASGTVPPVTLVAVRAYRAELIRATRPERHPRLSRLGPDLLAEPPDLDGVVARALVPGHGSREIADLLLDQRIGSGIGNVYKSEVLFVERIHPRTPVGALDASEVRGLYERAAELLRLNLRTRRRTTVPTRRRPYPSSPRLWVYGRGGDPCLECGATIERLVQGDMARPTWMCPRCQLA
jgi:endonuclease-8